MLEQKPQSTATDKPKLQLKDGQKIIYKKKKKPITATSDPKPSASTAKPTQPGSSNKTDTPDGPKIILKKKPKPSTTTTTDNDTNPASKPTSTSTSSTSSSKPASKPPSKSAPKNPDEDKNHVNSGNKPEKKEKTSEKLLRELKQKLDEAEEAADLSKHHREIAEATEDVEERAVAMEQAVKQDKRAKAALKAAGRLQSGYVLSTIFYLLLLSHGLCRGRKREACGFDHVTISRPPLSKFVRNFGL